MKWDPKEVYFSIDIEADGPIPGPYSMLSCGIVPIYKGEMMDEGLEVNFKLLEGAQQDPDTMQWWSKQGDMYEKTRVNTVHPRTGMLAINSYIDAWASNLSAKPFVVGHPVFFDYMFFYWYQIKFAGRSPSSFTAIDMKTLAWCKLDKGYRNAVKRNFPWKTKRPHTHGALDDALEQGDIFIQMVNS